MGLFDKNKPFIGVRIYDYFLEVWERIGGLPTDLNTIELNVNKKTDIASNKTSNTFFPSIKAVFDWVSGLFVKGDASSTDNAIARFDGATGRQLQNSVVTIGDTGVIAVNGVTTVQPTLINGVAGTISIGSTNTTSTGVGNQSYGADAGLSQTSGSYCIAQGAYAGYSNTTGSYWIAQGMNAGRSNTTGTYWIAQGASAGQYNTTGSYWIAQGVYAGRYNTTGSNWIAQGASAGRSTSTGNLTVANNTIHIGFNSKSLNDDAFNEIVIGANAVGNGNNTVTLGDSTITGTYLRHPRIIGSLIDSADSAGTDGQVLKKAGGNVAWSNILSSCSVFNTPTAGTQNGVLALNAKKHDVGNEFNTATNRFTVTVAGLYLLNMSALKLAGTETKIYFRKNGLQFGSGASRGITAYNEIMDSTEIVQLLTGDYIDVFITAGQVVTDYQTNKLSVTLLS